VTILTADANANGLSSPNDFDSRHNDKKGLVASFCDGHVEYIVAANLPKAVIYAGSTFTPANGTFYSIPAANIFTPAAVNATASKDLDPNIDFSPYLLAGCNGALVTLQDTAFASTITSISMPVSSSLSRGQTIVIKIGNVAAGDLPVANVSPVSIHFDRYTILDYYPMNNLGVTDAMVLPTLRYGLSSNNYRVGSYAVIKTEASQAFDGALSRSKCWYQLLVNSTDLLTPTPLAVAASGSFTGNLLTESAK
ncbi:MAG TPA: hypothetical protein VGL77_18820, partial [Armatimonadota bacterium]